MIFKKFGFGDSEVPKDLEDLLLHFGDFGVMDFDAKDIFLGPVVDGDNVVVDIHLGGDI